MNANTIINMIVRQVMRRVIGRGVNAGINAVESRMSGGKSDAARKPSPNAGQTQKRMRQTMRLTRKMGRF